jgi:hypothetical protein
MPHRLIHDKRNGREDRQGAENDEIGLHVDSGVRMGIVRIVHAFAPQVSQIAKASAKR